MKNLIKLQVEENPVNDLMYVTMTYPRSELLTYMSEVAPRIIVDNLAEKIVDDLYSEVLKAVDIEALTNQVTIKLASKISEAAIEAQKDKEGNEDGE